MKRARKYILVAAVLPALALAGVAIASGIFAAARGATAAYHDVDAAIAAGYSFRLPDLSGATCIESSEGGMGVHMVNVSLLDGTIEETKPEVMVYAESPNTGRLKLAAVEYVVFKDAWQGSSPPALFGRQFDFVDSPNRYGLTPFYALHAWIWRSNPSGILNAWNPKINCGDD
jgi:hypothetical protein